MAASIEGIFITIAWPAGAGVERLASALGHPGPTVGNAVNRYRASHEVDWKDWDEV
ncbi:MAG: hypothetical protein IPH64_06870 [Comamonadaceae bacterium]|nr:hypothetical protein [Comamonadaceae bacterium]